MELKLIAELLLYIVLFGLSYEIRQNRKRISKLAKTNLDMKKYFEQLNKRK